jgi:hypothetical protein
MSMEEPHAHMGESMESLSALLVSPLRASFLVNLLSPSASSLIQSFSVIPDLHHFSLLVVLSIVLTRLAFA